MTMRKFALTLSLALLIGVGTFTMQAHNTTPAHAASCYGSSCNDVDPIAAGCTQSAYLQETANVVIYGVNYGWVQNWWSQSCNANYTVAQANNGSYLLSADMYTCPANEYNSNGACNVQLTFKYSDQAVGYGSCSGVTYCHPNAFSNGGTTHWYTNMVSGQDKVLSLAEIHTKSYGVQIPRTALH